MKSSSVNMVRCGYRIGGTVQGVGFRPFVYRLAASLDLTGFIRNSTIGVEIEVQGNSVNIATFTNDLQNSPPPLACINSFEQQHLPMVEQETSFTILPSQHDLSEIAIPPDIATCPQCLAEFNDPHNRRYLHPFINCTDCGPRWTIVTAIPYDRPFTTMSGFTLCVECAAEYENPLDRRFHAQPIACPVCGPTLHLLPDHPAPLDQACKLLATGKIVAIKGLGGFHLAADACNNEAIARLRQLKQRDEKPFAVMVPNLETARKLAVLSEMEAQLLSSPEAPLVIVRRNAHTPLSRLLAPGSSWLGLMLAYTPLHQLLFQNLHTATPALVMTSANRSDEPMIADDNEAVEKLNGISDAILSHNRKIAIRTDDSVMRVFQGKPLFYRRSRGFVPRPIRLPFLAPDTIAFGAELKNTICITSNHNAFLSQHIGDLKNEATYENCRSTAEKLCQLLEKKPVIIACDQHPDYLSTRLAESWAEQNCVTTDKIIRVQHHHAHLASCMAENRLQEKVIGIIFDGTGLGDDGTIWGGEFFVGDYSSVQRVGHLKPVQLPGGDAAAHEPWRMAISWLYATFGRDSLNLEKMPVTLQKLPQSKLYTVKIMLEQGLNSPLTSSIGRLFDAVSALLGLCHKNSFDGQAAMMLETAAEEATTSATAPLEIEILHSNSKPFLLDPTPAITRLAQFKGDAQQAHQKSLAFHQGLAKAATKACQHIRAGGGPQKIVLSGGVFQNRLLTELICKELVTAGFTTYTHSLVPPNDGGIALGQAAIAAVYCTPYPYN